MKWIEEKMKLLGCDRHPSYKLAFYLDSRAMITIHSEKYGVIEVGIILLQGTCQNCQIPSGQATASVVGQVPPLQRDQHHHVRRPRPQLPDEPLQRTEDQAVQERAHLAEHGQGARETERLPKEDRLALVV